MYLETLLIIIAGLAIVLIAFIHRFIIEPALKRNGYEPRGVNDIFAHRDWSRYRLECGGSATVYWLLWSGYLLTLGAILLQAAQFFLFPGIRIGA